jgi:hypothetical protein
MSNLVKAVWMFVILPLLLAFTQVCFGALLGWSIGLVFGDAILNVLNKMGVYDVSMWQIGAFLGFVSSFFTNLITYNDKRKIKA